MNFATVDVEMSTFASRAQDDDIYDVHQRRETDDEDMPGRCCCRSMRKVYPITSYYWLEMVFLFISVAIIGYGHVIVDSLCFMSF